MAAPMRRAAPVTRMPGASGSAAVIGGSRATAMLFTMSTLPPPDADALAHSGRLQQIIKEQIAAAGGAIPFSRFMALCLYTPGLGYYSAGATEVGAGGEFR